jgi:uncharacterized protein (TIGR00369 family)
MTFPEQLEFTNKNNRFMRHCGIRILTLEERLCQAALDADTYCKNTGETIHGGLLYTMADCAVSAYARALGGDPVTLNGALHYLSNVTGGTILADAVPVKTGKTILLFHVTVHSGEKVLADGTFSCYRKPTVSHAPGSSL